MESPQVRDQIAALRALANRLTLKARDYAAEAKRQPPGDPHGEYLRGLAEAYYKSALELADILKGKNLPADAQPTAPAPAVTAPAAAAARPSAPPPPPPQFAAMSLHEVLQLLEFANATPRDVTPQKDGSFYAVFSRWQPLHENERIERIQKADPRIVIIASGRNRETSDPFVHFGFKFG